MFLTTSQTSPAAHAPQLTTLPQPSATLPHRPAQEVATQATQRLPSHLNPLAQAAPQETLFPQASTAKPQPPFPPQVVVVGTQVRVSGSHSVSCLQVPQATTPPQGSLMVPHWKPRLAQVAWMQPGMVDRVPPSPDVPPSPPLGPGLPPTGPAGVLVVLLQAPSTSSPHERIRTN